MELALANYQQAQAEVTYIEEKVIEDTDEDYFVIRGGAYDTYPKFCRAACIKGRHEFREMSDDFYNPYVDLEYEENQDSYVENLGLPVDDYGLLLVS